MIVVSVKSEEYEVVQDIFEKELDVLPRFVCCVERDGPGWTLSGTKAKRFQVISRTDLRITRPRLLISPPAMLDQCPITCTAVYCDFF